MSTRLPRFIAILVAAVGATALLPAEAHAVLGEDGASVTTVVDALSATRHDVERLDGLTLHRIRTNGLEVREYVAESTGQVVGIAWNGSREPRRIATILGGLMTEYVHDMREALGQVAPSAPGAPRVHFHLATTRAHSEHLVIERYSRMGLSRARVYLAALPPGVSPEAIQ